MSKKGVVVSGGGAWGAFGAGTLAKLNREYDVGAGISTGALMTPLVMINDYDTLKEAYCNTRDKDIFDLRWYKPRPIKKNGKVNMWAVILALILGRPTFGTTKAMRKHIEKFMKSTDYVQILKENKEVLVGCQNLAEQPSLNHYFSTKNEKFEDFKDWMWLSANASFACSIVEKEWTDPLMPQEKYMGQWVDGGLTEVIPLDAILSKGCTEIDVIIHRPKPSYSYQISPVKNLIENVDRAVKAMRYDIEFENLIETCDHMAKEHGIKITLYFLPRKLSNNSLVFNKEQMTAWWNEGYDTANDPDRQIVFEPIK
jgi:predicted patatin/cPLA2 family phospholipase